MKARSLILAGTLAGGLFIATPFVSHAAGDPGGSCAATHQGTDANGAPANSAQNHTAAPGGTIAPTPDGGTVYASGSGVPDGSTSGYIGIQGQHGYLEAGGDAANPNGGGIAGHNTDSGLNGAITAGNPPVVCVNPS